LSNRQLEIFALVGRGLDTAAIAERLRVSVKTGETHRSSTRLKLNLKNAADLVRHATIWTERF
jgi:DNA-binding NarL/FixJ family response regulator